MSGLHVDGLRWEVRELGSGRPVLLLHGFTGRGTSWRTLAGHLRRRLRTIVVDLPGHGRTAAAEPRRLAVERTATDLATILARLDATPAVVIGYSLGARIALRLAVAHPAAVSGLILESPSAGLSPAERPARRAADAALAAALERDGIEAFVDRWERQPIFASHSALPPARAARLRAIRLANHPARLAASLRGAGQGAMEPLHHRLRDVAAPTLVIAGALDPNGLDRARTVAAGIPGARLKIVPDAGHTPHDERPAVFRRLVFDFLQEELAA